MATEAFASALEAALVAAVAKEALFKNTFFPRYIVSDSAAILWCAAAATAAPGRVARRGCADGAPCADTGRAAGRPPAAARRGRRLVQRRDLLRLPDVLAAEH